MRFVSVAVVCLLFGCEAQIVAPGGSGNGAGGSGGSGTGGGDIVELNPCTETVSVGIAPTRRLSHDEYVNSLSDFQPTWATVVRTQAAGFTPDSTSLGFRNGAASLDVKPVLATQYLDAAEAIA